MMEEFKLSHFAMPFDCFLPDCSESITNITITSHFCSNHRIDFQEVKFNEKTLMQVSTDDTFLSYGRSICLGIIGVNIKHQQCGTALQREMEHFPNPFPIMIMAKRSNYQRIFDNNADYQLNKDADFLSIWLMVPKVKDHKFYSILTVYSEDYSTSISKSIRVKYITENQNELELHNDGLDYLIINSGILKKLSSEETIILEIILKENLL